MMSGIDSSGRLRELLTLLKDGTYGLSAIETLVDDIENMLKAAPSVDSILLKAGGAVCPAAKSIWDCLGDGTYDLNDIEADIQFIDDAIIATSGTTSNNGAVDGTTVRTALADAADYWNGMTVVIDTGASKQLSRQIIDFAAGDLTVYPAFPAQVVSGLKFYIIYQRYVESEINDIQVDLGDFSAYVNFASLLETLGIPDVAGKDLYTLLVTDRLDNATYGLSAIETLVDSIETWLGDPSGDILTTITAKLGDPASAFGGLIQAAGTTSGAETVNYFDTDLTEATDDHYNGCVIVMVGGTLAGQASIIVDYDGATKFITVDPAFIEAPDSDDFLILSSPLGALKTGAKGQEQIYDLVDQLFNLERVGDTTTTDGTEQTIYIIDNPDYQFEPYRFLIDTTAHTATETLVIRQYLRMKEGGNYIEFDEVTLTAVQDPLGVAIDLLPNTFGIKLTLEKTGGTNRAYIWEVYSKER